MKIEHFHNDEDRELRIASKIGMLSILQSIVDQGERVALFYGNGHNFIPTTLLGANEHGMWLDAGQILPENRQLLLDGKITFVSAHQQVKIQFEARDIKNDLFENSDAFYLGLPDYLLRIQRREFFRIAIPSTTPVKCVIPIQTENPGEPVIMREIPLVDISGGGVGLLCREQETVLLPNKTFSDCQISIPDVGTLIVAIEVRNGITLTADNDVIYKRVGCCFIRLNNQMNMLLQRYIARLQREMPTCKMNAFP